MTYINKDHNQFTYTEIWLFCNHLISVLPFWAAAVFGEQKTDYELKPAGNGEPVTYGHSLASNKKPTLKLAIFRSLPSLMQGHYSYHAGACRSVCSRYECFWACPRPHICPRSHIQADP